MPHYRLRDLEEKGDDKVADARAENHLPPMKKKDKKRPEFTLVHSRARATTQCYLCKKHRIIWSEKKQNNPTLDGCIDVIKNSLFYCCGSELMKDSAGCYNRLLHINPNLTCEDPMETSYFHKKFLGSPVCKNCGKDLDPIK